jgi:hypothetical protein
MTTKLAEPEPKSVLDLPVHDDPFYPVLKSSSALEVSDEQNMLLKEILKICSSDNQFAAKAFDAITRILTGAPPKPVVTSLVPNSAEIGDASFILHVNGSGFDLGSVINFAGHDEPTTLISPNEVNTGVDMSVWKGADVLPVFVRNSNGVVSESKDFTFTMSQVVETKAPKETKEAKHESK